MPNTMTLEQVEELTAELPLPEQLQLVADISARLSVALPAWSPAPDEEDFGGQREKEADALLALCDAAAELWEGEFDAADEISQLRVERDDQLCLSR